jgi:hypothetical protein
MSRGFLWVYWLGSFLVTWAILASFGALIKSLRETTKRNDDA